MMVIGCGWLSVFEYLCSVVYIVIVGMLKLMVCKNRLVLGSKFVGIFMSGSNSGMFCKIKFVMFFKIKVI